MNKFIDIHCHSTLRPFGQSFSENDIANHKSKSSIWYADQPVKGDKFTDIVFGLAKYSQSDLLTSCNGDVFILGVSLYAPEEEFFLNKLGDTRFDKWAEKVITSYGRRRINNINGENYRYFKDLQQQCIFLKTLDNTSIKIGDKNFKYKIISNKADLDEVYSSSDISIAIFINIEGGHNFGCGQKSVPFTDKEILDNVTTVKNNKYKPVYVTLAHHYQNHLVGHCKSLPFPMNKLTNQTDGMNKPFTELGLKVVDLLLDNSNGKRIILDIKHFSIKARKEYYKLLDTKYKDEEIPVLFSHGGLNGLKAFTNNEEKHWGNKFNNWDIGLFDEEIPRIARTKGLFGLNMDQRVMSSKKELWKTKIFLTKKKMLFKFSKLIWNHVERIAEILNENNLPAWDIQSIGTDYDGLINPIDGFWSEKEMPIFRENMKKHAEKYLAKCNLNANNMISADELMDKIMYKNAKEFLYGNL